MLVGKELGIVLQHKCIIYLFNLIYYYYINSVASALADSKLTLNLIKNKETKVSPNFQLPTFFFFITKFQR
jgi:hypothetical protein